MAATMRTKTKTQKTSAAHTATRDMEHALLALENACMQMLESQFVHDRDDVEGLVWHRKFKNIVTPVSLALREHKGPRHFHNHYKHREDDDSILHPVLDDPLETLAHTCQSALAECQNGFAGLQDEDMIANRQMLEQALKKFLSQYKAS